MFKISLCPSFSRSRLIPGDARDMIGRETSLVSRLSQSRQLGEVELFRFCVLVVIESGSWKLGLIVIFKRARHIRYSGYFLQISILDRNKLLFMLYGSISRHLLKLHIGRPSYLIAVRDKEACVL